MARGSGSTDDIISHNFNARAFWLWNRILREQRITTEKIARRTRGRRCGDDNTRKTSRRLARSRERALGAASAAASFPSSTRRPLMLLHSRSREL